MDSLPEKLVFPSRNNPCVVPSHASFNFARHGSLTCPVLFVCKSVRHRQTHHNRCLQHPQRPRATDQAGNPVDTIITAATTRPQSWPQTWHSQHPKPTGSCRTEHPSATKPTACKPRIKRCSRPQCSRHQPSSLVHLASHKVRCARHLPSLLEVARRAPAVPDRPVQLSRNTLARCPLHWLLPRHPQKLIRAGIVSLLVLRPI
ncbi:hypothetical protein VTI28DRAFT_223 [Corynascus sepedonium]